MTEKRVIAIVGATGAQGGGLARAILDDPAGAFAVRALTRDPSSDKARALAAAGAEVVAADVDDVDSLERAFAGAYGAFCVTFFWAHLSPEREIAQAENMAVAAQAAGLRHVIWSTLEDTRQWVPLDDDRMPTLQGKYKVPHYDGKGEANRFFLERRLPVTLLNTSFYWDNFIHFGMGPKRTSDGTLVLALPMGDKRLPGIAAEDIGKCALGIFRRGPAAAAGRTIGIAGGLLTGEAMAASMTRVLGETVRYHAVTPESYRSLGFPGAEDLGNMFQVKRDFEEAYCGARDVTYSRELNPELMTFDQWADKNKEALAAAVA
ncbi:MAG TPA: NmrA/HSCARG family protein [Vicinamibacterales bacterium]|nr:NmrA/HSCARG family protein [Vicinamibacterales bacterium]